jgi:hypothetical protein
MVAQGVSIYLQLDNQTPLQELFMSQNQPITLIGSPPSPLYQKNDSATEI